MWTFSIMVLLWNNFGCVCGESRIPYSNITVIVFLKSLFEKDVSTWNQKGSGKMIFIDAQRCKGRNNPLKKTVFSRSAMIHRCQANSSVLNLSLTSKWCVKFALEAMEDSCSGWNIELRTLYLILCRSLFWTKQNG